MPNIASVGPLHVALRQTTSRDGLAIGGAAAHCLSPFDRGGTCGKSRQDCKIWHPIYKGPKDPRGLNHVALTLALIDRAEGAL
jgi:hypothetical protein